MFAADTIFPLTVARSEKWMQKLPGKVRLNFDFERLTSDPSGEAIQNRVAFTVM
jgi:hypothetical protein